MGLMSLINPHYSKGQVLAVCVFVDGGNISSSATELVGVQRSIDLGGHYEIRQEGRERLKLPFIKII